MLSLQFGLSDRLKETVTDLRYPIGPFTPEASYEPVDRSAAIEAIAELPSRLRASVDRLSEIQLDTPYRPEGWTVRQVVHHLADSHMNSYIRFKRAVTESVPLVGDYDEVRWAELGDGREGPVAASLSLLEGLHARWTIFLKALTPADLALTFQHPARGLMSLDLTLALYSWHSRHHLAHIETLAERMGW